MPFIRSFASSNRTAWLIDIDKYGSARGFHISRICIIINYFNIEKFLYI